MEATTPAPSSLQGYRLEARRRFRAFNTDVELILADWASAWRLPAIEAYLHAFESQFSRFLPASGSLPGWMPTLLRPPRGVVIATTT
jgi:hypothetical protein